MCRHGSIRSAKTLIELLVVLVTVGGCYVCVNLAVLCCQPAPGRVNIDIHVQEEGTGLAITGVEIAELRFSQVTKKEEWFTIGSTDASGLLGCEASYSGRYRWFFPRIGTYHLSGKRLLTKDGYESRTIKLRDETSPAPFGSEPKAIHVTLKRLKD